MQIQDGHVASLAAVAMFWCASMTCHAQEPIDVNSYFEKARAEGRDGIARKTRTVDVRPSTPGEVIVTTIRGEGKETQSAPANPGDMVVRNRCPETGNEEILVAAGNFAKRYEGPIGPAGVDGWVPYRPQGVPMLCRRARAGGRVHIPCAVGRKDDRSPRCCNRQGCRDGKGYLRNQKPHIC